MRELISCGILEGSTGQMAFTCSLPLLSANKYKLAGQLVQWSVRNGGPGIPVLSAQQYYLLVGHEAALCYDNVVVPDANTTAIVQLVSKHSICPCTVKTAVMYSITLVPFGVKHAFRWYMS